MTPKRIQRRRTKGWRMPEGARYVGRPSRWGNPFGSYEGWIGLDKSLVLYREMAYGGWNPSIVVNESDALVWNVYSTQQRWLRRIGGHPAEAIHAELRGHDLACWCPLDRPCHADVLLELANAG